QGMWLDLGAAFAQSRRVVCLVALASMLAAAPAAAQMTTTPAAQPPVRNAQGAGSGVAEKVDPTEIRGLDIRAGVALDEIFTDNARGVASGGALTVQSNNTITTTPQAKTSDLVSRATPMLSIVDRTTRLQAGMVFQPSYQKYALAHDLDRFENALQGTASAELWREHFFLDGSISMSNDIAATLRNGADTDRLAWTFLLETSRTSQGATPDAGQVVNNVAVPTATN